MELLNLISEKLQAGKAKDVKALVQQAIDEGVAPKVILEEGLLPGMSAIGEKFKNNEVFVPEVLVAARAMNQGVNLLKPLLAADGVKANGKVCIGTVQGDLHDIGKNIVKMMMEGKGLEVIDLGTDVPAETFVQTAKEQGCQVICCSALLTTTMDVMADVVKAAEAAGIRDQVKIMVGGAPINEEFCKAIGADCYTVDAASASDAAVELCKGLEVIDLGTDVSADTFVKTAKEQGCQVICCSALLTTTMNVMAEVVKAAEAAGIREQVKIMIGGAPVTEEFAAQIGADAYTTDAATASDVAVQFCA